MYSNMVVGTIIIEAQGYIWLGWNDLKEYSTLYLRSTAKNDNEHS